MNLLDTNDMNASLARRRRHAAAKRALVFLLNTLPWIAAGILIGVALE